MSFHPTCPLLLKLLFGTLLLSSIQCGAGTKHKNGKALGDGYTPEALASLVTELPGFGPPPSNTFSGCDTFCIIANG